MAFTSGGYGSFDFNRMVVLFTMLNGDEKISCAISTDAMNYLEGTNRTAPNQLEQQFERHRERIERRCEKKFLDRELEGQPPGVILRRTDF
jgi:hypothetical protein